MPNHWANVKRLIQVHFILSLSLCCIGNLLLNHGSLNDNYDDEDLLQPYLDHHGPKYRTHRQVRECQNVKYGNVTHSKVQSHGFHDDVDLPVTETRHLIRTVTSNFQSRSVKMHYTVVSNPFRTVTVLEPGREGSCRKGEGDRSTVMETSKQKDCLVAINAGFFNTHNGACLGNIISDGRLVQDSGGIQNAHFGITNSGHIFIGYLSEIDLVTEDFRQLVGGVIWLVRDGESYINESINIECSDTEETGTLTTFATVLSACTAIGHDKDGRVMIMQADGRTHHNGLTMKEFVDILLEFGFVNAINLDGGGSSTYVVNGTLVNYPSDKCKDDRRFNCARKVSTVVCVHEPECSPNDCSGHGSCDLGKCVCSGYWSGKSCDLLRCPGDCSGHGVCSEDGCVCEAGYHGNSCNMTCPSGYHGNSCQQQCTCFHSNGCDPVTGSCQCQPVYTGTSCEKACPFGTFGENCTGVCNCGNGGCPCDPVSGSCNFTDLNPDLMKGAVCYSQHVIKEQNLQPDQSSQLRTSLIAVIVISAVCGISIILNLVLGYRLITKKRKPRHKKAVLSETQQVYKFSSESLGDEISSFSDYPMQETSFSKKRKGEKKLLTARENKR